MMSRSSTAVVRSMLGHAARGGAAANFKASVHGVAAATYFQVIPKSKGLESEIVTRLWLRPITGSRNASTVALGEKPKEEEGGSSGSAAGSGGGEDDKKGIVSYWGIETPKLTKEDGSEWKWNCFRPGETYQADLSIDLKKHHAPVTFLDKLAYWTRRYGCRAMMLETVAAVPGMVGGLLLHCKSLRRFEHSGGWIKALIEEAENERMHLMTFMEVSKPMWHERALVFAVQGIFFNAYFVAYLVSPKLAHRIVGYLEEEAIHSYTEFLKELDKGNIENVPSPAIAIDYWRLPQNSTLLCGMLSWW